MAPTGAAAAVTKAAVTSTTVNVWVLVNSDNTLTIIHPQAEMGQGIGSGLAQTLSEELPMDWTKVTLVPAPFGSQYASAYGSQVTGGSFSTRSWFNAMLTAGAAVRTMLMQAAATLLSTNVANLLAQTNNTIKNVTSGATVTYAQAAAQVQAGAIQVPGSPTLLSSAGSYKVIGTAVKRPDVPDKTTGKAVFGIDVRVPGMVYASVKNAPYFGATVKTVGSAPSGTLKVVNLGDAVAVVAANTYAAIQGARSVSVTWNTPTGATSISSASATTAATSLMNATTAPVAETVNNVGTAMAGAAKTLTLNYSLPYLPHAAMEVVNCTASITATSAEIWAPTQAPDWVANTVAAITKLDKSKITVHTTLLGGAFGRKIEQDFIAHAVKTAVAMGKPVKLTWSREEDFGHDRWRPMALSRIVAGLDNAGNIVGWTNRVVTGSVGEDHWPGSVTNGIDTAALDGALGSSGLVYAMGARKVEFQLLKAGIPIGWWRSVGHSYNCFAVESAIDELAQAAGQDPLAYRQKLLASQPRHLAVLNAAASLAGYSTTPPAGTAYGIALSDGFGSIVAVVLQVTQVTTTTNGTTTTSPKILNAWCAIDCGQVVNPDQVVAQMQSGVVMGITSAMWGRATFSSGKADQSNFSGYYMARMKDVPPVQVRIITPSTGPLGGVGETMVPPIAPALANAFARLTGTRKRSLPLYTTFPAGNGDG